MKGELLINGRAGVVLRMAMESGYVEIPVYGRNIRKVVKVKAIVIPTDERTHQDSIMVS